MGQHSRSLIRILKPIEPKLGCEVGVWAGENSKALLEAFPQMTLLMVDYYQPPSPKVIEQDPGIRRRPEMCSQEGLDQALLRATHATQGLRRILLVAESQCAAQLVLDASLDFVFIDADHIYECIARDVSIWAPKVRSGGVISGHDYGGGGDRRRGWGVTRAVDEFVAQHHYQLTLWRGRVWCIYKP